MASRSTCHIQVPSPLSSPQCPLELRSSSPLPTALSYNFHRNASLTGPLCPPECQLHAWTWRTPSNHHHGPITNSGGHCSQCALVLPCTALRHTLPNAIVGHRSNLVWLSSKKGWRMMSKVSVSSLQARIRWRSSEGHRPWKIKVVVHHRG